MSQSRREFLQTMVGTSSLLSLAPVIPSFLQRAVWAAGGTKPSKDRVLVVLQLSGGNDGLNSVVPYGDDVYGRNRKSLRLTKNDVLRIDDYQGFHPQLTGFHQLLEEGQLRVLHGVGYPHNNRDHEPAMREWHTARPSQPHCPTGWVGRAADADQSGVPAVFVGSIPQPFALQAAAAVVPSVADTSRWTTPANVTGIDPLPLVQTATENPLLELVQREAVAARATRQQVESVLANSGAGPDYPRFKLAGQLKNVSQLIQADLGIRIFFVELGGGGIGGFDNHANQRDNHAALLRQMSQSILAFVRDLQSHNRLSQVLLMTFSEFGRTVTENGRLGTGHGAAAPVFLVGGTGEGGVIGQQPSLTDLDQDALKHQVDYRQVYATMLQKWLGYDAQAILGGEFPPLDIFSTV